MLTELHKIEYVSRKECAKIDILKLKAHIGASNPALTYVSVFVSKGQNLVINPLGTYVGELDIQTVTLPRRDDPSKMKTYNNIVVLSLGTIKKIGGLPYIDYIYLWRNRTAVKPELPAIVQTEINVEEKTPLSENATDVLSGKWYWDDINKKRVYPLPNTAVRNRYFFPSNWDFEMETKHNEETKKKKDDLPF